MYSYWPMKREKFIAADTAKKNTEILKRIKNNPAPAI